MKNQFRKILNHSSHRKESTPRFTQSHFKCYKQFQKSIGMWKNIFL